MDAHTQILYNRALAELGLCAFRRGLFGKSLYCLQDLYSINRTKELLAQGVITKWNDSKSAGQEKNEKRGLMPFHLHINLEMLESVYCISSALHEATNLVRGGKQAVT